MWRLRREIGLRPRWLAASTHQGEEELAAAVHARLAVDHPGLLTIVAPRHPARGDAVAAMLAATGLRVARRSRGEPVAAETQIYLADTMGDLGLLYSLARIAFIGGSMTPKGGHNPFEAARLDCAVLHGPDMSNCTGMASALAAAGASETVSSANELAHAVSMLLGNRRLRAARCAAGVRAAAGGQGVLDAVLARLSPWLDRLPPTRTDPCESDPVDTRAMTARTLRA